MSFDSKETSRAQGEPINLYLFVGSDALGGENIGPYAYTDAETAIVYGGVTYQPIPISRDSITSAGTLDNTTLEIKLPQDADISEIFVDWAPSQVISLFIRQGHANDTEFLVCWTGRLLGFEKNGPEMSFTCEPISTSIRRPGLRRRYQYGCPHVLYGPQCQADMPSATNTAGVVSVNGDTLVLTNGWNAHGTPSQYTGGFVSWTDGNGFSIVRRVLKVFGAQQVLLSGPPSGIGSTVKVVLGCNHLMSGCNLHNNILNYGGDPWIPKVNPLKQVNYYS